MTKSPENLHPPTAKAEKGYQFGTFKGVFTPSILTVLGVIMYLRLGWVLGNLGLGLTILVVTIATAITFVTALSISELATNMKIGGGGAYYIISRSLGVEAGAAIGLPLFFAQALGISFYVAGFAESLVDLLPQYSPVLIGVVTLVALTVLAYFSADLALRVQFLILTLIFLSLISFFLGHPTHELITIDPGPGGPSPQPFWKVFAVFFPAVTGIEAGLAMSGDLKDTERSLPRGTMAAVLTGYAVYLLIPLFLTLKKVPLDSLISNTMVMRDFALWGKLVMTGLWGAALSSALGALLGAPRTLQALAKDGVIPRGIGRGFGQKNDPRLATGLTFVVALLGVLLGNINIIAPILSMFFLTSYGLLNLSAGLEGIINNPSWRPKFRIAWHWSILGSLGCIMVMLMINPGATFLAVVVSGGVYYYMQRRRLNAYWGDMRYGIFMWIIRSCLYSLTDTKPHHKTWRPNLLVLSGSPSTRWHLIELADAISQGNGFVTVAAIVPNQAAEAERQENIKNSIRGFLEGREVPAFVKIIDADQVMEGAKDLIQAYGFGPLQPNTVLLGDAQSSNDPEGYVKLVMLIAQKRRNLIVMREKDKVLADRRRIDLWWRRIGNNSGLMLALAYLLKTSPEWEGSELVIKTIVRDEAEKVELTSQLNDFIDKENMEAETEVYIQDDRNSFEMITQYSQDASLVFIGLRGPEKNESVTAYQNYYQTLLNNTADLPNTVMVLAAEELNFAGIFQFRQ